MADNDQFEEIHRCLNHAFKRLSDLLNAAEPKDRQRMLRVMTLNSNRRRTRHAVDRSAPNPHQ